MPLFLTLVLHFLFALRVAAQGEDVVFAATTTPQAADDEETASGTSSEKPVATTASVTATIPPAENATVPITTTWPVATLFLPMSDPGNLAASIISTHPNYTAYALGCLAPSLRPSDAPDCNLSASLTLSEGVSTVIYTHSFQDDVHVPQTISCLLHGPDDIPEHYPTHASKAACTARSDVAGLGYAQTTTTLASTQITYADVTITEGPAGWTEGPTPPSESEDGDGESDGELNAGVRLGAMDWWGWVLGTAIGVIVVDELSHVVM